MPIPSPYYGNNYVVITGNGATFAVGADPISDPAGYTYYLQYYKPVFGVSGSYTPVTSSTPLPVTVSTGLTATISGFCGSIQVQGIVSGTPVTVSGSVVASGVSGSPVYVRTASGAQVEVTGGRYLNKLNDAVSVYGPAGSTYVYTQIVNTTGSVMGTTANPLQVSFSGVTISGTFASVLGVTNDSATSALKIQGLSGGTSVAVTVGNTVGINDTNILTSLSGICSSLSTLNSSIASIAGVVPSSFKAGKVSVTSSAVQMDATGFTCSSGINIKSAATNTTLLYLGNTSGISTSSTGVYALDPGEEIFIKVNNTGLIYLVSNVSTTAYYNAS